MTKTFLLLLTLIISSSSFSQEGNEGNSNQAGNRRDADEWSAPSISSSDYVKASLWRGNLTSIMDENNSFLQRDVFRPNLEVNTNRGSLKASFSIPLPPNFVGIKNIQFSYNHRQKINHGVGVGWRIKLPSINSIPAQKDILLLKDMSGGGEYQKVTCPNNLSDILLIGNDVSSTPNKCYKARLDEKFYLLIKKESGYLLFTRGAKHYEFSNKGLLSSILNNRKQRIEFKWKDSQLSEISFEQAKLKFNYFGKEKLPVYSNSEMRVPTIGLKDVNYFSSGAQKKLVFSYLNSNLTRVTWENGQKSLFWGSYAVVPAKKKLSDIPLPDKNEKETYVSKFNPNEIEAVKVEDDKDNPILYVDLNQDGREEKIIVKKKSLEAQVRKFINNISYNTTGSSNSTCVAKPKKSTAAVENYLNGLKVPLDIVWAKVSNESFYYSADKKLKDILIKLFSFEVSLKKTSSDSCEKIYYYDVKSRFKKTILGDFDYDGNIDVLLCHNASDDNSSILTKTLQEIQGNVQKFLPRVSSTFISFPTNTEDLKEIDSNEVKDTNVLENVRDFKVKNAERCSGETIAIDINNDGHIDLYHGDSATLLSPFGKKEIKITNELRNNLFENLTKNDSDKLALIHNGKKYQIVNSSKITSTIDGTLYEQKDNNFELLPGSSTALLTEYRSDFGGKVKIDYINKNKHLVVSEINKVNLDQSVENRKEYTYTSELSDFYTGVFVGYSKTQEKIYSSTTKNNDHLIIKRVFLKDARADVPLLEARARLQGRLLSKEVSSTDSKEKTKTTNFWYGEELQDDRQFVYIGQKDKEKYHDGLFSTLKLVNKYLEWNTKDIPEKHLQETYLYNDLTNIFDDRPITSIITNYKLPSNLLLKEKSSLLDGNNEKVTEYVYNDYGEPLLISNPRGKRTVVRDQFGRISEQVSELGEVTTFSYDKNEVQPAIVRQDDIEYKIERTRIFRKEKKITSSLGIFEFKYNDDLERSETYQLVGNKLILRQSKETFVKDGDFLQPKYHITQNEKNYSVELNSFGHPHKIVEDFFGEKRVVLDQLILDGKIVSNRSPYFLGDRSTNTSTNFDSRGRVKESELSSITKKIFSSFKYNKNCKETYVNGIEKKVNCSDALGRKVLNKDFDQTYTYDWYGNGQLQSVSNGLVWNTDKIDEINKVTFDNVEIFRDINLEEKTEKRNGLSIKFDSYGRNTHAQIGRNIIETAYKSGQIVEKTIHDINGNQILSNKFTYEEDRLVSQDNTYFSKNITYDDYGKITKKNIQYGSKSSNLNYKYNGAYLESINPYISKIKYNADMTLSEVVYANGTVSRYRYDPLNQGLVGVTIRNGRNTLFTSFNKFNSFGQLEKSKIFKPTFAKNSSKEFYYTNSHRLESKGIPFIERGHNGSIEELGDIELNHCGEYLCSFESNSIFSFIYDDNTGLVGGTKGPIAQFNPNARGSYLLLSADEALIEGDLVELVKVEEVPVGLIINNTFYPAITNHKKEVIGLINSAGDKVLFIRDFSLFGNKKLLTDGTNQEQINKLDNITIWSFGRMLHNPLIKKTNKNLYWSKSRVYSAQVKQWTSFDPYVAFKAKNLVGSSQDWNPYVYCNNEPINCVDPSGHFALPVAIGAGIGATTAGLAAYHSGARGWDLMRAVTIGAGSGALAGTGLGGIVGSMFIGGSTGMVSQLSSGRTLNDIDLVSLGISTAAGGLGAGAGSFASKVLQLPSSVIGNSLSNIMRQNSFSNAVISTGISGFAGGMTDYAGHSAYNSFEFSSSFDTGSSSSGSLPGDYWNGPSPYSK